MNHQQLKAFLDQKVFEYNRSDFIVDDPISIPHQFNKKQDIEVMAFFAAVLAWGQRKTILHKCQELINLFDHTPIDFILNHQENDLKRLEHFKHRTFNSTDLLYFVHFLKHHYTKNDSLETAFVIANNHPFYNKQEEPIANYLNYFRNYFTSLDEFPDRTKKHISSPMQGSTCKRLNMFLRWMVRKDENVVDFGIWKSIQSKDLICPIDLHVERIARQLKLITRKQVDWKTAIELTAQLRKLDPNDPVKYDFALFGLGVYN